MTDRDPLRRSWREPAAGTDDDSHPLRGLQSRMSELFEDMWQTIGRHHHGVSGRAYSGPPPQADLSEGGKDWRIDIEVPGIDESDLEILCDGDQLVVRGEKKVEREDEGRDYYLRECRYGRFSRRFDLPGGCNVDRIAATYRNGVLSITLPKAAQSKSSAKKIPIKGK